MAKNSDSDDKDKHRLKTQRETIIRLEREIKILKLRIRTLEKDKPPKEEKALPPKKLTPAEAKEAARKKFAEMFKKPTE